MPLQTEDLERAARALRRIGFHITPDRMRREIKCHVDSANAGMTQARRRRFATRIALHLKPASGAAQQYAATGNLPNDPAARVELIFQLHYLLEVDGRLLPDDVLADVEEAVDRIFVSVATGLDRVSQPA